ncbi:hypothetical protein B0H14DRAFT_3780252 [Mycena olivaceomarginata]|nr:hypothetical protein B0H14DRAFT_3780252 [Mycena olivaceomarginata]
MARNSAEELDLLDTHRPLAALLALKMLHCSHAAQLAVGADLGSVLPKHITACDLVFTQLFRIRELCLHMAVQRIPAALLLPAPVLETFTCTSWGSSNSSSQSICLQPSTVCLQWDLLLWTNLISLELIHSPIHIDLLPSMPHLHSLIMIESFLAMVDTEPVLLARLEMLTLMGSSWLCARFLQAISVPQSRIVLNTPCSTGHLHFVWDALKRHCAEAAELDICGLTFADCRLVSGEGVVFEDDTIATLLTILLLDDVASLMLQCEEVLTPILELCPTIAVNHPNFKTANFVCRVTLSHVCRRWREIALKSSTFWTHIVLLQPRWALEMLHRSRAAPLAVGADPGSMLPKQIAVRDLRIPAPLLLPAPVLETFHLHFPDLLELVVPANLFAAEVPRLQHLSLQYCSLQWDSPLWVNLVSLELIHSLIHIDLLASMLHLRSLTSAVLHLRPFHSVVFEGDPLMATGDQFNVPTVHYPQLRKIAFHHIAFGNRHMESILDWLAQRKRLLWQ